MAESRGTSVSLLGILGVLFVGLKLAKVGEVATWSWWWVLSPFWAPLAVGAATLLVGFAFVVVAFLATQAGEVIRRKV